MLSEVKTFDMPAPGRKSVVTAIRFRSVSARIRVASCTRSVIGRHEMSLSVVKYWYNTRYDIKLMPSNKVVLISKSS